MDQQPLGPTSLPNDARAPSGRTMERADFECVHADLLAFCAREVSRTGAVSPFIFSYSLDAHHPQFRARQQLPADELFAQAGDTGMGLAVDFARQLIAQGQADLAGCVAQGWATQHRPEDHAEIGEPLPCLRLTIVSAECEALVLCVVDPQDRHCPLGEGELQFVGTDIDSEGRPVTRSRRTLH